MARQFFLWKLAHPGVIRIPFLSPEGEHIIAGIGPDRRILAYARVFDFIDEIEVVRVMDCWLRRPDRVSPLPAPLLRPVHDEVHHHRWVSFGK